MTTLNRNNEFWLDFNGTKTTVDGVRYVVKASTYEVIYPYRRNVLSVYAEPVNKNTAGYREAREALGDDWALGVLSNPETAARFQVALVATRPVKSIEECLRDGSIHF